MAKRQSLSVEVAEDLKKKIQQGNLALGSRIPTEAELCEQYEVSRTVVREAIVRLRSEGLVISRQGLGVFVSRTKAARHFAVDWNSIRTLPDTIALLELRLAVEVEAAGLCASRRTKSDAKSIREWMEKDSLQSTSIENTKLHYDFDFHLAIAKGTKNPHFHNLMLFLRPIIVPRIKLRDVIKSKSVHEYDQMIHAEHEAIVAAIEVKDEEAARQSMRTHLKNSLERVRNLAVSYGVQSHGKHDVAQDNVMRRFVETIISAAEG